MNTQLKYTNTLYRFYRLVGSDTERAPGLGMQNMRDGDGGSSCCDHIIEYVTHSGNVSWGNEEGQCRIRIHSAAPLTIDDSSSQLGYTLLTIE